VEVVRGVRIAYARGALADLARIAAYLRRRDPGMAVAVRARLRAAVDGLGSFPNRGRPGPLAGTRELVVRPYLILYRPGDGRIEVLAVRHGAQRPLTILPD